MNGLLFIPEIILTLMVIGLLCLLLIKNETAAKTVHPFMLVTTFFLIVNLFLGLHQAGDLFYGTYRIDTFSQGFKLVLAFALFFTVVFSSISVSVPASKRVEYFLFLCTATLGMAMLVSAMDILTLYVSLELSSYSLYVLSALRNDKRTAEAGVKYLIFGAATSGFLLWGLSLISGLAGSTSLLVIAKNAPELWSQPAFALGLFFACIAFLFKLSAFPAHFWAPDVYEAASTSVTAFIATASKVAAVAILARILILFNVADSFVVAMFSAFAFISMTLGNSVALVQSDVKRLLAYSSIAQAGYILIGLLAGSFEGYSSGFFYAVAYMLMNAAAFLVVAVVAKDADHDNPQLSHFDGLADRSPFLALVLLLSLLSLAGIPPLVGFTGKWILFSAAMEKGHWFLVLWGVLNSVVSLFYYLTLVKHAYLGKSKNQNPILVPSGLKFLGLFLFLAIVILGVFPNQLILFARQAVISVIPS